MPPAKFRLIAFADQSTVAASCNSGFMHNDYGGNDLEMPIQVVPEGVTRDDGGKSVTVGGHDGVYRRIDALNEEWIVDIESRSSSGRSFAVAVKTGDPRRGSERHPPRSSMYPRSSMVGLASKSRSGARTKPRRS